MECGPPARRIPTSARIDQNGRIEKQLAPAFTIKPASRLARILCRKPVVFSQIRLFQRCGSQANDPDWQKIWAESKADGKLVTKIESAFVNPTDYSPLK